jgi:hypothetical protein
MADKMKALSDYQKMAKSDKRLTLLVKRMEDLAGKVHTQQYNRNVYNMDGDERRASEAKEKKFKEQYKAIERRIIKLRGRGGGAMTDLSQRTGATAKSTLFKKKLN